MYEDVSAVTKVFLASSQFWISPHIRWKGWKTNPVRDYTVYRFASSLIPHR
jgi:hypothetical protein